MTRINLVPVSELSDQHLLAEHREIKRIPNKVGKNFYKRDNIHDSFKLGTGHEKFFIDKLFWLFTRYRLLRKECIRRGFNITDYSDCFWNISVSHEDYFQDWEPSQRDIDLSRERIQERLQAKPDYYRWSV